MSKNNFILLHLKANNKPVSISADCISVVIKDLPAKGDAEATCVYLKENSNVKRIFVNESVERVYNMIISEPVKSEEKKES